MRQRTLLSLCLVFLLTTGCRAQELYTPAVQVRPESVGYGSLFSVRLYGAVITNYRFMGARQGQDGTWTVRIDPVQLRMFTQPAEFTVRPGDILPLGPDPSILVRFSDIQPTRLMLTAVAVYKRGPGR